MQEKIIVLEEAEGLRVKILGEIDHHNSVALRSTIDSQLFNIRPEVLILDFSSVKFMDSSGIGLIIGRLEKCKSVGARLRLTGLSKTLCKIVSLSGLEKLENLEILKNEKNTK